MPFQKSKHLLVASLLVATTAFANDENILSKERLQQFKYDKEKK
jgi:hypothetical protein